MALATGAAVLSTPDADAANVTIKGDTNVVKVKGTLYYDLIFYETEEFSTLEISYSADLKDSSGKVQSSAVTPSSGALSNGVGLKIVVTAPSEPGRYTLTANFTETIDDGSPTSTVRSVTVTVVNPITLSTTIKNTGSVSLTDFVVYFKVDGKLIDESKTLVSVEAGAESTVTYEWVTEGVSSGKHDYAIVAGDENIGEYKDLIIGSNSSFWVGHSDYGGVTIAMFLLLIVLLLIAVYVYRKPVKNYGKPKARR
ncbi:MAG: hypothetical protein LBS92_07765 [Candidatus Methanoplasma sp.]|nr:hypothetical protein [Candidatus Methanoplasma sp.]